MFVAVKTGSKEESYLNKDLDPPRNMIRTVPHSKAWIEDSRDQVDFVYAQTDPHYTDITYHEIVTEQDGSVRIVEVPRG